MFASGHLRRLSRAGALARRRHGHDRRFCIQPLDLKAGDAFRQLARQDPARADLCEELAARFAGKLLAGNCGRSAAADEAK
jgi:DNA-binding MarR family transcriptional regulator